MKGLACAVWLLAVTVSALVTVKGEREAPQPREVPAPSSSRPADSKPEPAKEEVRSAVEGTLNPSPGWLRVAKSLLYYDGQGTLSGEIGLGRWEDSDPTRVYTRIIDGGTSKNSRFAWTLETRSSWNTQKTKLLESKRVLRFFGPGGKELWSEEAADFPAQGTPLVFSQSGEICLVAIRRKDAWYAQERSYLGNPLWEVGPFNRLESMDISPAGRYGAVRWTEYEKSSVHSFLEFATKTRKDVDSSVFFLGDARIDDQGVTWSGRKNAFPFAQAPVRGAAPQEAAP